MFTEKFHEVISHEGVVSIVSWSKGEPHIVNTWNSYLVVTEDSRLLIPAAGMRSTEEDFKENRQVKITLGSKEVQGMFVQGAGFRIEGSARFVEEGAEFDRMKDSFPFLSRVLEICPASVTQTL